MRFFVILSPVKLMYDSLYFRIQETIRRLLHLIPTDPAVLEVLEKVASRRSAASAFSTAAAFDVDIRSRSSIAGLNMLTSSKTNSSFTRIISSTVVGHASIATSPTKSNLFISIILFLSYQFDYLFLTVDTPTLSVGPKPSGLANSIRSASFRRTPHHHAAVEKTDSKESVEDLLRGLLNPSAPLMSPFRILYNLEVRSSILVQSSLCVVLTVYTLGFVWKVNANCFGFNYLEQYQCVQTRIPLSLRTKLCIQSFAQGLLFPRRQLRNPAGMLFDSSSVGSFSIVRRGG